MYETFIDGSAELGNLFLTLECLPCDGPEDHEIKQTKNKSVYVPQQV
jgi:hypothetical protein